MLDTNGTTQGRRLARHNRVSTPLQLMSRASWHKHIHSMHISTYMLQSSVPPPLPPSAGGRAGHTPGKLLLAGQAAQPGSRADNTYVDLRPALPGMWLPGPAAAPQVYLARPPTPTLWPWPKPCSYPTHPQSLLHTQHMQRTARLIVSSGRGPQAHPAPLTHHTNNTTAQ
jgi:hypothetical protein